MKIAYTLWQVIQKYNIQEIMLSTKLLHLMEKYGLIQNLFMQVIICSKKMCIHANFMLDNYSLYVVLLHNIVKTKANIYLLLNNFYVIKNSFSIIFISELLKNLQNGKLNQMKIETMLDIITNFNLLSHYQKLKLESKKLWKYTQKYKIGIKLNILYYCMMLKFYHKLL